MLLNDIAEVVSKNSNKEWESVFALWSSGPSVTEQRRAENAERQIKQAIEASEKLKHRDIGVITQGSYRNRVNVRKDSDVDIGIVCFDTYFPFYPDDNVKAQVRKYTSDAVYTYACFKNEIEEALIARFGRGSISRGSKSFDIKENSYRVEADVAAFFEHRRYITADRYLSGVEMIPDDYSPPRVRNWPEQHYKNGVDKNTSSGRRFERIVRILKTLSNEMSGNGVETAKKVPSFLVECLVFNTPNHCLMADSYCDAIKATLAFLYEATSRDEGCSEWGEVSELKYLFRSSQPWCREDANRFILDAWKYIGF